VTVRKPHQWLAWLGTAGLLIAATLAAFNFYPFYIFAFIIGNSLWAIAGWLWKEQSLVVLNVVITLIYVIGLFFK